jgi:bifunctional non-homologous end joining protein LigD
MPRKRERSELAEYQRKRDFSRTPEPKGRAGRKRGGKKLEFVIQKHAATSLHYDLRLELDDVMKSWAVPKGPSLDPKVKRLAMEVEDHPMEYNTFEGTIPRGEYGGGTVLIWDRGTYFADEAGPSEDEQAVLRREHRAGKLSVTFEGERLRGSFALVRTDAGPKPKWLLIKHRDDSAAPGSDIVADYETSVVTGRTLDAIAADESSDVWHSDREAVEPMEPTPTDDLPAGADWIYEPRYIGERVLAYVTPESHRLVSAAGLALDNRVPSIAEALEALARRTDRSFVLDGVATGLATSEPELRVFDVLLDGGDVVAGSPWKERRERLESLFRRRRVNGVRVSPTWARADAGLFDRAAREGGHGIVAKRTSSPYHPGSRSQDWVSVEG